MLHLENKSFLTLLSPFALFALIWVVSPYGLKALEERIDSDRDAVMDLINTKGEAYRTIQRHESAYASLVQKMITREQNRFWIAQQMYHPIRASIAHVIPQNSSETILQAPPPLLRFSDGNITSNPKTWSVQMVLPLKNMAIINNKIMRVGQRIDGVQLLQVETSKVLIHTDRGDQWIKLFY